MSKDKLHDDITYQDTFVTDPEIEYARALDSLLSFKVAPRARLLAFTSLGRACFTKAQQEAMRQKAAEIRQELIQNQS